VLEPHARLRLKATHEAVISSVHVVERALAASEEEFRAGKGVPAAEVIAELRRR